MWIIWVLIANCGIMWLEFVYRSGQYNSFLQALPCIVIPMIIGQVGLFYGFRYAPSLFLAGAVFTLINVFLRVINSYRLDEVPNNYNWLGIVFLILSTILLKVK